MLSKKRLLNPDASLAALHVIHSARIIFGRFAARFCGVVGMQIDTGKIDEAVLALLYLTLHDGGERVLDTAETPAVSLIACDRKTPDC